MSLMKSSVDGSVDGRKRWLWRKGRKKVKSKRGGLYSGRLS